MKYNINLLKEKSDIIICMNNFKKKINNKNVAVIIIIIIIDYIKCNVYFMLQSVNVCFMYIFRTNFTIYK